MSFPLFQVDAFTHLPFSGNPAAVCLLSAPQKTDWMQAVAAEMNLSETAFLYPSPAGETHHLRWFTPVTEVDLCGHATLASAHVLWEEKQVDAGIPIRFETRSGVLRADKKGKRIAIDFPAETEAAADAPPDLLAALGLEAVYVGKTSVDYLVEVENESMLRAVTPDFRRLKKVLTRGVMVTARASCSDYDFVSRFFAPAAGIDEDPVTGSAHCVLGPYWEKRIGKKELKAYQASLRGGVLKVRCAGERVCLEGEAVTVLRGSLLYI